MPDFVELKNSNFLRFSDLFEVLVEMIHHCYHRFISNILKKRISTQPTGYFYKQSSLLKAVFFKDGSQDLVRKEPTIEEKEVFKAKLIVLDPLLKFLHALMTSNLIMICIQDLKMSIIYRISYKLRAFSQQRFKKFGLLTQKKLLTSSLYHI